MTIQEVAKTLKAELDAVVTWITRVQDGVTYYDVQVDWNLVAPNTTKCTGFLLEKNDVERWSHEDTQRLITLLENQ